MQQIIQKVNNYIEQNQLLTHQQSVIIGLSGGADSMALLHILHTFGYRCIAAHCNFHLRGEESNRDEAFVEKYCKDNNIEYKSISFDTYGYMKEKNISLEMAARELRYNWFDEISLDTDVNTIAVAHHRDDSVETILINLIRGCGIRGLTGIPIENGKIIRPLLCLSRNEILEYLSHNNIEFVNDSTNDQDEYTRNKIRLNILPQLEEINPSVRQSIQNMSEYLRDVEQIYLNYISDAKNNIFENGIIDITRLQSYSNIKSILFEILYPYGFNSDTILNIYKSIDGISGKIFYSDKYRLIKDRNKFILENIPSDNNHCTYTITESDKHINNPINLSIHRIVNDKFFSLEKNKNILYLDADKIRFPFTIRKWQQGDWFIPLGMKGRKKISDYFTDNKFSVSEKETIWLLCSPKDEIIWIIGERTDNRFKLTEETKNILRIELSGSL